jgi:FKBP-type peptidyl-prolyl cis-trans isomerase SlyD
MSASSPPLRIVKDVYVVLDYVLYDDDGDVIEATDDEGGRPIGFVQGYGSLVAGLERGIVGMAAGETKDIVVAPHEGYGEHDESLERWVDKSDFPPDVALDDEFEAEDQDGRPITLRVVEVGDDAVLVDENHPLAGEELRFEVMIRAVRPATAAELRDVRAHAPKPRLMLAPEGPTAPAAPEQPQERGTQPTEKALRKGPASAAVPAPAELDDEQ